MTLAEIKAAIEAGKTVHWKNTSYEVKKDNHQHWIVYTSTGHAIGLTWQDGITMNGKEKDFFTA